MNDHDLDQLFGATAPVSDRMLVSYGRDGSDELRASIMAAPTFDQQQLRVSRAQSRRPRSRRRLVVAAVMAIVGVVLVIQRPGHSDRPAFAAPLVKIADSAPRLLVTGAGWHVTQVNAELDADQGDLTFSAGAAQADLTWYPAALLTEQLQAWSTDNADLGAVTIAGATASLYRSAPNNYIALWVYDGHTMELSGRFPDEAGYRTMAALLQPVDVNSWLTAMPASAIKPVVMAATVKSIAAGLPIPSGLNLTTLGSDAVTNRYQLGAKVTGAIACGWIHQWLAATAAQDDAKAAEALHAMATSHRWPILLEMRQEGGWPQEVWEFADAMATGKPIPAGTPNATIAETYRDALGCH